MKYPRIQPIVGQKILKHDNTNNNEQYNHSKHKYLFIFGGNDPKKLKNLSENQR